jgi:hypothetical protein
MLCCGLLLHPGRDSCVRSLLSAVPHPMSKALSPAQSRHCPPAGSVLVACVPLVFRLYSACIPLVLAWVCPAPPPPYFHPALRTAHTTALHYRDAAAPEKVTALLRRESPLQPSKGLQFKSLPAQAQTSRMARFLVPAQKPAMKRVCPSSIFFGCSDAAQQYCRTPRIEDVADEDRGLTLWTDLPLSRKVIEKGLTAWSCAIGAL